MIDRAPATPEALDPEDTKLIRLARTALGRAYAPHTGAAQGAAVRDTDGRTYAAATVELADPAWTTTALRGALVAALSSGARRFEACVVVGPAPGLTPGELRLLAELAPGVPVLLTDPGGTVVGRVSSDA